MGYGRSKGISGSLIASCTFDNIICLILFGVCKTIAFQYAADNKGGDQHKNFAWEISSIFVHNVAGVIAGIIMGCVAWLFKFIDHWKSCIYLKATYCIIVGIGFIIVSEFSTFKNAKYIACLTFGYVCFRFWGESKPAKEIASAWFFIQPFLFGTIGAALLFS